MRVAADVEHLRVIEQRRDRAVTPQKLGEPGPRTTRAVDGVAIADDTDARDALLQRDEPDPVAGIAEVDGRQHAAAMADARAEAGSAEHKAPAT